MEYTTQHKFDHVENGISTLTINARDIFDLAQKCAGTLQGLLSRDVWIVKEVVADGVSVGYIKIKPGKIVIVQY